MISRVSKTLYKENSLETLANLRADSQKPYSDLSRTKKTFITLYSRLQRISSRFSKKVSRTLRALCKNLELILKNRVQNCLELKNVFRILYSRLQSISSRFSETISKVPKTLYKENSLEPLTKDLEQILKNRIQICLETKKHL